MSRRPMPKKPAEIDGTIRPLPLVISADAYRFQLKGTRLAARYVRRGPLHTPEVSTPFVAFAIPQPCDVGEFEIPSRTLQRGDDSGSYHRFAAVIRFLSQITNSRTPIWARSRAPPRQGRANRTRGRWGPSLGFRGYWHKLQGGS